MLFIELGAFSLSAFIRVHTLSFCDCYLFQTVGGRNGAEILQAPVVRRNPI